MKLLINIYNGKFDIIIKLSFGAKTMDNQADMD